MGFFPYQEAYNRAQDTPQQEFIANYLLPEVPADFDTLLLYCANPDNLLEYLGPFSFSAMCAKQNNVITGDVALGKYVRRPMLSYVMVLDISGILVDFVSSLAIQSTEGYGYIVKIARAVQPMVSVATLFNTPLSYFSEDEQWPQALLLAMFFAESSCCSRHASAG